MKVVLISGVTLALATPPRVFSVGVVETVTPELAAILLDMTDDQDEPRFELVADDEGAKVTPRKVSIGRKVPTPAEQVGLDSAPESDPSGINV